MHPVCFRIGSLTVHWYGVLMAVGFLLGFLNWVLLSRREGRRFEVLSDLLFWIMVGGIVGARVAYVIADLAYFAKHPLEIIRVDRGGLIYYGGLIGAGVAIWWFARRRKQRMFDLLDLVITSVPLAHALGRIGCFLNGCCFGTRWAGPWAIRYPADSHAWCDHVNAGLLSRFQPHSLPVHPVQLYEAGLNLLLFAALVWLYRHRRVQGVVVSSYLLGYPLLRFGLEFLRGDARTVLGPFSAAQWISIGLFAAGCVLMAWTRRRAVRAGLPESHED